MTIDKLVFGVCLAAIVFIAASDLWAWWHGTVPIFVGG